MFQLVSNTSSARVLTLLPLASLFACLDVQDTETPPTTEQAASDPDVSTAIPQGAEFRLALTDATDVASYDLTVTGIACPGTLVPLSPFEHTWSVDVSTDPLTAGPDDTVDGMSAHKFSQWAVPLAAGCYQAVARPHDVLGGPSHDCLPSLPNAFEVMPDQTVRVALVVQCPEEGIGAGDVLVLENRAPRLELEATSTVVSQCTELELCFQARDPDTDPIEFEWLSDPKLTIVEFGQAEHLDGGVWRQCATVRSETAGAPEVTVTAFDLLADGRRVEDHPTVDGPSRTQLTLPIHVTENDSTCAAQPGSLVWHRVYGESGPNTWRSIASNSLGHLIVGGELNHDIRIGSYDRGGEALWFQTHQGVQFAYGVAVDAQDNVLATGVFSGPTDSAIWVGKFDSEGEHIWSSTHDTVGADWGSSVTSDNLGNIVVAGRAANSANFDLWVGKYDSNGTELWTRIHSAPGTHMGNDVATDIHGNIVIVDQMATPDFGSIWIRKYDPDGEVLWTRQSFGIEGENIGCSVATDSQANILVSGSMVETPFVKKYRPDGTSPWVHFLDTTNSEIAEGLAVDIDDNIFLTAPTNSGEGFELAKLGSDGQLIWQALHDIPDLIWESVDAIALDSEGYLVATGSGRLPDGIAQRSFIAIFAP